MLDEYTRHCLLFATHLRYMIFNIFKEVEVANCLRNSVYNWNRISTSKIRVCSLCFRPRVVYRFYFYIPKWPSRSIAYRSHLAIILETRYSERNSKQIDRVKTKKINTWLVSYTINRQSMYYNQFSNDVRTETQVDAPRASDGITSSARAYDESENSYMILPVQLHHLLYVCIFVIKDISST